MRFSARLTGLLAAFALLTAFFVVADSGAASASPGPQRAEAAAISKGKVARAHGHHGRHKRQLARIGNQRAVSDNVGLKPGGKTKITPPTSTAGLLFNGAHISDFSLLQQAPGAFQEVSDPAGSGETNFQVTVSDRDVAPVTPTDNPRAQALSPPIIDNGEEFWLATKFMIPTNFPTVDGWMSLVSIYGAPFNGSSPWQVEVSGNKLQWMRNGSYRYDVPWSMPLVKGSWVNVLLHERFATDGWVEMWINGQQVNFFGREPRLAMQTMDSSNNAGPNAAKIMQYREAGMFDSGSVFFGPLKLGLTRESVGG
ncbi:MAG TPA: heparin lyase I family protein [Solirubrobacterales bacterium]|jgi:hypothetical protein|nr:heparin lyase I family protein [Solirubrobacterales bacterium]